MRFKRGRIVFAIILVAVLSNGAQGGDTVKRRDPFCRDGDSYTPLCTNLIVTDTCHYGNIANTLSGKVLPIISTGILFLWRRLPSTWPPMRGNSSGEAKAMPPPPMPIVHLHGYRRARRGGVTRHVWRVIVALGSAAPSDFMGLACGAVPHRAIHSISMTCRAYP